YVMYVGYLLFELKSILENLNKMGIDVALFKQFIDMFSKK
ncbi:TPA: phage holin family protein, partial [Streptococcus equi subsp. equi]|nr:phage holin family protein [Streptococcus equi subsp. equi]